MSQELKIMGGIGIASLLILIATVYFMTRSQKIEENIPRVDASKLVTEQSHRRGSSSASVVLVEFGDYQCPACAAAHPVTKKLLEEYDDKVQLVFRHFPLQQHANAQIAAEAAEASGAQGKYWEMHDLLYEHQNDWAETEDPVPTFVGYAEQLAIDSKRFEAELKDGKYTAIVKKDEAAGDGLGVNSTPTFYVNGRKVVTTPSYVTLRGMIDQELGN